MLSGTAMNAMPGEGSGKFAFRQGSASGGKRQNQKQKYCVLERMTLKVTKNYRQKLTRKRLTELNLYRASRDYYNDMLLLPGLSSRKRRAALNRLQYSVSIIEGIEQAMMFLTPTEREIIELHYIQEHTFEDIEDVVHLERSSVYRHHAKAVEKIATVLFGAEEYRAEDTLDKGKSAVI